jgi:microcystin degradation protein MlrC
MLRHSDAVVSYLTYPHVDMRTTGSRAAHCSRILDEGSGRSPPASPSRRWSAATS